MGKPVSSDVKRAETTALNTKVNKEVFTNFKDSCAYLGYPMNVLLETFMQQYANGRFEIEHDNIIKWKKDDSEVDTLNTTFNKEIYLNFKASCKGNGYFVKHLIMAFMEKFSSGNYIMEFVEANKDDKE
jgi:hypothetical protein